MKKLLNNNGFFKKKQSISNDGNNNNKAQQEKEFRANIDSLYKTTMLVLSVTTAASQLFCPPLSYAATALMAAIAIVHYYDKTHDYRISHYLNSTVKYIDNFLHRLNNLCIKHDHHNTNKIFIGANEVLQHNMNIKQILNSKVNLSTLAHLNLFKESIIHNEHPEMALILNEEKLKYKI